MDPIKVKALFEQMDAQWQIAAIQSSFLGLSVPSCCLGRPPFHAAKDYDGNRVIDKDEFWDFVEKFSPGMLPWHSDALLLRSDPLGLGSLRSRSASDELHEFIDADKSGGIAGGSAGAHPLNVPSSWLPCNYYRKY